MHKPRENPPSFIYLQTSRSCNLRCTRCEFWKLEDRKDDGRISWEHQKEIVKEFASIGGKNLVTCGGEPSLDFFFWLRLMKLVRELGLTGISVTNGTTIKNEIVAEKLVLDGPHEITISIDGPNAEIHDALRGVKGSFEQCVKALTLLVNARKSMASDTKIYAMTIVGEEVYRQLPEFYDLILNKIGADKLKLNIQQPSFGQNNPEDLAYDKGMIRNVDEFLEILYQCNDRFKLNLNPNWINDVRMYYESLNNDKTVHLGWKSKGQTKEHICNTYDRNIMVDLEGYARLCFSTHYPGTKLNVKGDLKRFWNEDSLSTRERMLNCNRYCGISHSVRKSAATMNPTCRTGSGLRISQKTE
jgi:MoaA/NifB/PqqE/SkfB family radical SAM enzyme